MTTPREISTHYTRGNLLSRLNAALKEDGADPDRPSMEALAPYDHFHGRGLEATLEVAQLIHAGPADHLLDIGSGIGGPARYFAKRFGCKVTGIDLTPEFCDVARHLTRLLALEDWVAFEVGDALAMPFAGATFDGAYSMNVSMNIADKTAFYREIHRVLKPGAGSPRRSAAPTRAAFRSTTCAGTPRSSPSAASTRSWSRTPWATAIGHRVARCSRR